AAVAEQFGGEPKTEMWYIAEAASRAELFVGLTKGATRAEFERRLKEGTVAECLHGIRGRAGGAMFLPRGRLHAIGAGNVIFEIQQNSDTTYRVFDWNRVGLDGKPRELHLSQSLASIDFNDFEPELISSKSSPKDGFKVRHLVNDPLFCVDVYEVPRDLSFPWRSANLQVIGLLRGRLAVKHAETLLVLNGGEFCLLPACLGPITLTAHAPVEFLHVH